MSASRENSSHASLDRWRPLTPRPPDCVPTLRAYFSLGQNASAAGALLKVHERTVGYRLATIEERIGHPITRRRDELGLALRLHALIESDSDVAVEGEPAVPAVRERVVVDGGE